MKFRKIAFLIIATLACDSAALARGGGHGTSGGGAAGVAAANRSHGGRTHFFIVREPLPIRQAPTSTGTVGLGGSPSQVDSRIDSRF
jgi:hypothetical protein